MTPNLLQRLTIPTPGYPGWRIVLVVIALGALSFPGQSFALALYVDFWIADLGLSRVEVSSLYGAATLVASLLLPGVGRLADRTSSRAYFTAVLAAIAAGAALLSTATGAVGLALALILLRLLGQGAIGIGGMTTVVRWFALYRGRALALAALGYPLGELCAPWLIHGLQGGLGWRSSLLALAGLYLCLLPLSLTGLRERKPDEPLDGLDGLPGAAPAPHDVKAASSALRHILRAPRFWGLLALAILPPSLLTAALFHQVALLAAFDASRAAAAQLIMAYGLAGVCGSYVAGLLVDQLGARRVLPLPFLVGVFAFGAWALGLPALPGGALGTGALLGAFSGSFAAASAAVWPECFGVESLGALKGVVSGVRNAATAAAPPLVAWSLEAASVVASLWALGAVCALAAALGGIALRRPLPDEVSVLDCYAPHEEGRAKAPRRQGQTSSR